MLLFSFLLWVKSGETMIHHDPYCISKTDAATLGNLKKISKMKVEN